MTSIRLAIKWLGCLVFKLHLNTIWHPTSFWPFKYQSSLVFRSPLSNLLKLCSTLLGQIGFANRSKRWWLRWPKKKKKKKKKDGWKKITESDLVPWPNYIVKTFKMNQVTVALWYVIWFRSCALFNLLWGIASLAGGIPFVSVLL